MFFPLFRHYKQLKSPRLWTTVTGVTLWQMQKYTSEVIIGPVNSHNPPNTWQDNQKSEEDTVNFIQILMLYNCTNEVSVWLNYNSTLYCTDNTMRKVLSFPYVRTGTFKFTINAHKLISYCNPLTLWFILCINFKCSYK